MLRLSTSVFRLTLRLRVPSARRLANGLIALGFVAGLAIPLVGTFVGSAQTLPAENRNPAPPPTGLRGFSKQFDAFYADRTGGRRLLLGLRNELLLGAFGESPTSLVISGNDGWLYLNSGIDPLDPKGDPSCDIPACAAILRERDAWCRARGIRYIVQIAREKNHIYPDHLPERMRHAVDPVPLLKAACPDLTILDPRDRLRADPRQLYYKLDTHWNGYGAVLGYRQLAETLAMEFAGFRGIDESQFTFSDVDNCPNDLARLMGMPPEACLERMVWAHPPLRAVTTEATDELVAIPNRLTHLPPTRRTSDAANTIHLVLLHDSFGIYRDYLAGDVHRMTSIGTYGLPRDWLEAERPTVVVQMFVERAMQRRSFYLCD